LRETIAIPPPGPGRFIVGFGSIIPNQRLAVTRRLIFAGSMRKIDNCDH
jgi:hypothetical protein